MLEQRRADEWCGKLMRESMPKNDSTVGKAQIPHTLLRLCFYAQQCYEVLDSSVRSSPSSVRFRTFEGH
jgi:hypothetical protein